MKSFFYTDTLYVMGKAKSTRGNIGAQIYVSDKGFVAIYLIQETKHFVSALKLFSKEVGAHDILYAICIRLRRKRTSRIFATRLTRL